MSLPLDHSCEGFDCEPDDEEHRELRRKLQQRAMIRANFKADQAWARARESLPALLKVRNKLDGQAPLLQEDIDVLEMAVSLLLGELFLRKAQSY
jgi:hypothetical protein